MLKAKRDTEDDVVLQANLLVERIRQRRIRRKMGFLFYYFIPWRRKLLNTEFPKRTMKSTDQNTSTKQELNESRKKLMEVERRKLKLEVQNPVTREWESFLESKKKQNNRK